MGSSPSPTGDLISHPAPPLRKTFLDFSPPAIGEEEVAEVIDTLRSGWITTGPKVVRFEQEFAAYLGAPGAVALSSATAALHVALVCSGVGPGDVVITTPMTFCSCVHVIEHVGARPLLVDVEPDTLNIDPAEVERAIKAHDSTRDGRLRAILPVHLYGHPCDLDPIVALAREYSLAVIEDAAHALPATYKGRMIGCENVDPEVPRVVCFSFYATKNMTTGEGGMLVAPQPVIDEARVWSLHGMSRDAYRRYAAEGSWFYDVVRPGFKYNMPDIQAAIGLRQLRRLSEFQARRSEIVRSYHEAFRECEQFQVPVARPNVEHAWHIYAIRLNVNRFRPVPSDQSPGAVRNAFIERLKARNIGASVHFIPIHLHRYYREKYGYRPEDYPIAFEQYTRLVSLPVYPRMTDTDVRDVIHAVRDVVETWDQ